MVGCRSSCTNLFGSSWTGIFWVDSDVAGFVRLSAFGLSSLVFSVRIGDGGVQSVLRRSADCVLGEVMSGSLA